MMKWLEKKKKNYHQYDTYYYQYINNESNYNLQLSTYQKAFSTPTKKTLKVFTYLDGIGFGTDMTTIKSKIKGSLRVLKNDVLNDYTTLVYKKKVDGKKCRIVIHFYQNKLFSFSYHFSSVSDTEKKELVSLLEKKYETSLKNSETLIDANQNRLLFTDDFELSIHYMNPNNDFYTYLEDFINQNETRNDLKVEKEKEKLYKYL